MNLHEWTGIFLKHRDLHKRSIDELTETAEGYDMRLKDTSIVKVVSKETLDIKDAASADIIVFLNTKDNATQLAKHWPDFVKRDITIVSANPITNEKWMLKTQLHARVADEKNIKQGLIAMTEAITQAA